MRELLFVDKNDQCHVDLIIRKVNDITFIDRFERVFSLCEHSDQQKSAYLNSLEEISKNKKLFQIYLKNRDFFLKRKKLIAINEYVQKIAFCILVSVDFDTKFYSEKYAVARSKAFEDWLNTGLFTLCPVNKSTQNNIQSYEFSILFLVKLITGNEPKLKFKEYSADESTQFIIDTLKQSPYFDVKFYLNKNQDVKSAGIDPYYHYAIQGYKEGRSVSYYFDPDYYLESNQDVKSADVNPVYHYTLNGFKEKRSTRNALSRFVPNVSYSVRNTTPESVNQQLTRILFNSNKFKYIFISHDDISSRTGGIQKVIKDELRFVSEDNCLVISPTVNKNLYLVQTPSGSKKGYATKLDLRNNIKSIERLIVHSIINFDSTEVLGLGLFDAAQKIIFWVHDYSSACSNFLLLRNNFENCGAPPLGSSACSVCCYGETRASYVSCYQEIFSKYKNKLKIVTPSDASRSVFLNFFKGLNVSVREHYKISGVIYKKAKKLSKDNKLNVAYVGTDQPHKGLGFFVGISSRLKDANFFMFSEENRTTSNIKYVSCTSKSQIGTINLLKGMDIDVVILPSKWEETFCLTAYEALAAGCLVLCFEDSGNLSKLSAKLAEVKKFKDADLMFESLKELSTKKELIKKFFKLEDCMNLEYVNEK